jgi:hypothetical protein
LSCLQLTTTITEIMKDRKSDPVERVVCKDLTRGREPMPIQVIHSFVFSKTTYATD